jgi:hypothetical protein
MTTDDKPASPLIALGNGNPRPSAAVSAQEEMAARPCPICGSEDESHVYSDAHIDLARLDEFAFASRKLPEYMHYSLIVCPVCDLLYASPAPSREALARAYQMPVSTAGKRRATRAGPTPGTSPRSSAGSPTKMERSTSARAMERSFASYSQPASPVSRASSRRMHRYPPPKTMSES